MIPGVGSPALLMEIVMVAIFLVHDFVVVLYELKADNTERSLYGDPPQEACFLGSFSIARQRAQWREVAQHDSIDEFFERVRSLIET